jgi:hypothetical protein
MAPARSTGDSGAAAPTPTPIRIARSVTLPTYQLRAAVHAPALPVERQMEAAVRITLRWVSEKLPIEVCGLEEMPNPFRLEVDPGTFVETVWKASTKIWAMRLVHPDTGDVRAPVAGRAFTTNVSFMERGGAVEVAVQTLCTQPPGAPRDVDVVRPALVSRLAKELGLRDVLPLDGKPVLFTKDEETSDLRALLRNPYRSLPIVVFRSVPPPAPPAFAAPAEEIVAADEAAPSAPADEAATTAPVLEPPKGLDTSFLAEKLLGYAAVVHLSGAAADGFPQKVPAEFRVDAGGVRVYQPAMDEWRSESAERHPRFPEESLRYWSVAATDGSIHTGPSAFAEYLVRVLRSGMAQRTVDWRGVLRFPEVFDAFLAERQDNVGPEDCRDCRGNYETRINALREEIERLQSENEYFVDEAGHAESEAAVLRQDRFLLEERVTRLTEELEGKLVPEGAGDAAEPARLDLVPDWARARFGRRLILLPRAVRELKAADFEDVTLLCDALRLLATDYYDMHVGKLRVAEFTDRARALGLTWGPSIDETQAGRHGEAYFVQYPLQQGRGRRTFLQQHLRKGTSFESRHCLRIYFFWGEEDQKVVIGSLPRHLPSSAE